MIVVRWGYDSGGADDNVRESRSVARPWDSARGKLGRAKSLGIGPDEKFWYGIDSHLVIRESCFAESGE